MTLTPVQVKWLGEFGGMKPPPSDKKGDKTGKNGKDEGVDLKAEWRARREEEEVRDAEQRDFRMTAASNAVLAQKNELRKAFDFVVKIGSSKEQMRDDAHGNQEDEVDTIDVLDRVKNEKSDKKEKPEKFTGYKKAGASAPKKDEKKGKAGPKVTTVGKDGKEDKNLLAEANRAFDIVAVQSQQLEKATTGRSVLGKDSITLETVLLFDAKQIGDLFYTPLVRARLIPENVVINKFSATQKMLDATAALYKRDLKDGSDPEVDVVGFSKSMVGIGGQIATLVTSQFGVDTTMVKELISAGVQLVDLSIDAANQIHLGIEKGDVSDVCSSFPKALGALVGAATGRDDLKLIIEGAGTVVGQVANGFFTAVQKKGIDPTDITNLVKNCIGAIMETAVGGSKGDPGMVEIAALINDSLSCLDAGKVGKIVAGLKSGKWPDVASGMLSMLSDVAAGLPNLVADGNALDGKKMSPEQKKTLGEASDIASKSLEALSGLAQAGSAEDVVGSLQKSLPNLVGSIVTAATGDQKLGDLAGKGAGDLGALAVLLTKAGKEKKMPSVEDLTKVLQNVLTGVIATIPTKNDQEKTALDDVTKLIGSIDPASVSAVAKGLEKGDWKSLGGGLLSLLSGFAKTVPGLVPMSDQDKAAAQETGKIVSKSLMLLSETVAAKTTEEVATGFQKELPGILGQVVAAATGDQKIGALVKANSKGAFDLAALVTGAAKTGTVDPSALSTALTSCIKGVVGDINTKTLSDTQATALTETSKVLLDIAGKIGSSPEAATLLGDGDLAAKKKAAGKILLQLLLAAPSTATEVVGGSGASEDQKDGAAKVLTPAVDVATVLQAVMDKAGEEPSDKKKAAEAEIEKLKGELEAKYKGDAQEAAQEKMDALLEERKQYLKEINDAMNPDAAQKSILKMIEEMKKRQAILSIAITVGSAGAEVAGQFFGPLAIGKEIIMMVANIAEAIQRAVDLKKVLDAQQWAESAVSPYRSAIDNFVKNQSQQLTEYSIKAAMNALRIASEIAAVGYPMAKPIAAGVSIAQAAVAAGFTVAKEADLKRAWSVTKKALAAPNNRKLGLKAHHLNPTLAKYAIAYGAYEAKDPVAVKTMNEIGLSNDMLNAEDAGVDMVKAWLETKFKSDGVVAGKWDPQADWEKKVPQPVLTSASLYAAYKEMAAGALQVSQGKPVAAVFSKPTAAPIVGKFVEAAKAYKEAGGKTAKSREAAKAKDTDIPLKEALLTDIAAELKAGQEALRLLKLADDRLAKEVGAIEGASLGAYIDDEKPFKAGATTLVLAYRELVDDEVERVEGELLSPAMEQLRVNAAIKELKNPKSKTPEQPAKIAA